LSLLYSVQVTAFIETVRSGGTKSVWRSRH